MGFSLTELIVVIALMVGGGLLVLSTVSSVRRMANDANCQNNLRQIVQGLVAYTLDNKGYFPYGMYFKSGDPVTWAPLVNGERGLMSWAQTLGPWFGVPTGQLAAQFRCPEAQAAYPHPLSYVINFIVGISPYYELAMGPPPRAQTKPAKLNLMMEDGTALLWDTAVQPGWENYEGFLVGADIDDQRFWRGASTPQFRYYSPHDPFAQIPPGIFGNNKPIRLGVSSDTYRNIDPPSGTYHPYQGNLRFRHDRKDCNAGFSDGSVRQFTAVVDVSKRVTSHNALRRYFMIHWPVGVTANPGIPH